MHYLDGDVVEVAGLRIGGIGGIIGSPLKPQRRDESNYFQTLEQHAPRLVIRGHKHWPHPLAQFSSGLQVLNVDKRVVILTK
jgi:hypothetical protein